MKVLAFGASNSKNSINQKLALYVAHQIPSATITTLDLNNFEMPIFSVDKEIPGKHQPLAEAFLQAIAEVDLLVISLAEHNGSYSAAFKNILDWSSRINGKLFQQKPVLLLATSPGARGGASVLEAAKVRFPFLGADIKAVFSLPEFNKNFDSEKGIINEELKTQLFKSFDLLK
ncbi:MAG: NAD(P)H-dependent oxidoreductase [Bdellovibrionaceae bacterium]|nr:NAD(P)H-dependent oxidoreductase [Pseudobdellovibrionaceae bacterium]NUM59458.1 NAD(P)H-dependent oxidoreductase [Pseudobdellovibrionaceae bacterium]